MEKEIGIRMGYIAKLARKKINQVNLYLIRMKSMKINRSG